MVDTFKSKIAVHRWLLENGYEISKSQFYAHCKDGLLRQKKGGGYSERSVKKYASLHVKKSETGEKERDRSERMRDEKLEVALEKEKIDRDRARFDLERRQGLYMPIEEFELAVVGREVAFMAHFNHSIQKEAENWVELVKGDQKYTPALVDAISKEFASRMSDFAADIEVEVVLEVNNGG